MEGERRDVPQDNNLCRRTTILTARVIREESGIVSVDSKLSQTISLLLFLPFFIFPPFFFQYRINLEI